MSKKLGTGPRRVIFPLSLTKSEENWFHISKNFTNFVYKLHIIRIYNLKIGPFKLLIICNMCNFLNALFQ